MAGESFVHDDPEFGDLLTIVAGRRGVAEALVEKDYWVTHTLWALRDADSWTSEGVTATRRREGFFRALDERIRIPGADVEELSDLRDRSWRSAIFAIRYPGQATDGLPEGIRPFVQLEVGSARVTPGEERPISSWVHDHLRSEYAGQEPTFIDNRPQDIHSA